MKKLLCAILAFALLAGCTAAPSGSTPPAESLGVDSGAVQIRLEDGSLTVTAPEGMAQNTVTQARDIIYYESGHDETYGEGESYEAHTAEEAAEHTVIHINAPGTYALSGTLPLGQIAVNLGENAKDDPNAVVTLVLDGLDITCRVAPAIIFYNVYESGEPGGPAGANVILAPGSRNSVTGSHVAKIYKPGTEDKLHKYDAAFYSRMSMNIGGSGVLRIDADNEGLGSEMHLTINGGEINIGSGNDGINTNADGVSVTTINGGKLWIAADGTEGDGIDSNGSIVINGGHVEAYACADSGDFGLDADLGVQINGGTVIATGNMLGQIGGSQTYAVFSFAETQKGFYYTLKDQYAATVLEGQTPSAFSHLLLSSPDLIEGKYTLWSGDTQFEGVAGQGGSFYGNLQPIERPEWPDDRDEGRVEIPPQPTVPVEVQGVQPPQGEQPENMPVPNFSEGTDPSQMPVPPMPEGSGNMPTPQPPAGVEPPEGSRQPALIIPGVLSQEFPISQGANYFTNLRPIE